MSSGETFSFLVKVFLQRQMGGVFEGFDDFNVEVWAIGVEVLEKY